MDGVHLSGRDSSLSIGGADASHIATELGLQGERLYALEGLRYPQIDEQITQLRNLLANYSAAALFVSSAQRVMSGYRLQDQEVPALIRLCRLVDGLPLAIELAAGWADLLLVGDIVTEITRGLSFLESRSTRLTDRHRNMEAVFEVSWQRLARKRKSCCSRSYVFSGRLYAPGGGCNHASTSLRIRWHEFARIGAYSIRERFRWLPDSPLAAGQFGVNKLSQTPAAAEMIVRKSHCAYFCTALKTWDERWKRCYCSVGNAG